MLVEIVGFYRWCKVPISFMRGYEWKKWQNFTRKIILFEKSTILYMLHIWHFLTIFGSFVKYTSGNHKKYPKWFFFHIWYVFYDNNNTFNDLKECLLHTSSYTSPLLKYGARTHAEFLICFLYCHFGKNGTLQTSFGPFGKKFFFWPKMSPKKGSGNTVD